MTRSSAKAASSRPRISIDVDPRLRKRLRLAAAKRDVSVGHYVIEAVRDRLREDVGEEAQDIEALTAEGDPVLAELWDNPRDAAYDEP